MRLSIVAAILCLTLAALGCAKEKPQYPVTEAPRQDVVLTTHSTVSIQNYRLAREYVSEGRFELAREHYLLAYAAANDDAALKALLHQELESVDLMIKTLR